MKTWAEKRRREMEAMGATELARMFELVVKICQLDEEFQANATNRNALDW